MNKKTKGAWIIHHSQKLKGVVGQLSEYEQIDFAGKCGLLLNALAGTQEINVDNTRLYPLAKANGISTKLELPSILDELEKQRLIDRSSSGVAILGLMDLGFSSAGYAISACLDIDPYSHVPKFLQLTPIV